MDLRLFGEVFVTLVVIMDPPGNVPIFLSVTRAMTARERNRAALIATATALLVISLFALLGRQILDYLNVSIEALQGAGGLLLLLVALQLLRGDDHDDSVEASPEERTSIAMVPLGTPLMAGPGAIVTTIVFVGQADGAQDWALIYAAIAAVLVVSFLALRYSGLLIRVIRPTGVLLLSRVAGMLLAAIAVQMMADAVISFAREI
jgi:multiple antibiotic resistance protein